FSEAQPLTFYVVPWPVLTTPLNLTMDEIQWDSVDAFFQALQGEVSRTECVDLLGELQRLFHPDR
ncbi:hypothetical protein B0H10DRAFT_1692741, partial [Mycena sp. CBHHK59/15]